MPETREDRKARIIDQLRSRNRELGERLARVEADRRKAGGPLDPDFAEQAVERENDEVLDALVAAERGELARIGRALERIEADCFGICDDCGDEVDPGRLEALPEAALCLPCAEASEAARR